MGTLFECLKEARLEKYYPSFRAQGITKSEALTRLTVHDCPSFGINSAEDKRRLLELINIVKSVHNVERGNYLTGASNRAVQNVKNKSPRKRNRSPAQLPQQASGRNLSTNNDVRVRERLRTNASSHHLSVVGATILDLISDDESTPESSTESDEHSDYEPAVKHSVSASVTREVPLKNRKTPVETIKYGAGYNYGVPGTGSKGKTGRGSNPRLHEDKIKVCVRKRPLSKKEVRVGEEDMIITDGQTTLNVSEPKQAVDLTAYTLKHEFMFDEVFEDTCTNEDVYIRAARPLINCLFDGGSATCFAYGQTGAGKTHTMIGSREIPGLYLLAAHDIFSIIESRQYGTDIKVWVSFFEIYCGQLFDLLNKRNRLHAREDGSQRVCIAGLTETEAKDEQTLMQVLEYGNSVRSKGATGVNPDSSRSHAVLQMEIRDSKDKRLGRISFIDLAGSERASDSADTDKQTRMEGAEINTSLLALKECIRSIDHNSRHKPFRQSKLTHILKDSFIGNSRTCMIANISPASSSCEHTLNTLRYADRVKELRRNATSVSTSKSMNVAMSNILMNIPASAPSLFQPSNILCSSTPMRQGSRQFTNRNTGSELQFDPNETPIKGPGAKRKTSSAASRSDNTSKAAQSRASASSSASVPTSAAGRAAIVRHMAQNVVNTANKQNTSSNSESDQTDTDSCNVTGPQKTPVPSSHQMHNLDFKNVNNNVTKSKVDRSTKAVASSQNIPVIKSTDTENDFPTTDFNDEQALNDLNRTDGKNNVAASVPVFPLGGRNQSSSQYSGINDKRHESQSSETKTQMSSVSASVPVLRKKMYAENPSDSEHHSQNEASPAQNDFRQHNPGQQSSASRNIGGSSAKGFEPGPQTSGLRHSPETTKPKDVTEPKTKRPLLQMPLMMTESFESDMLFDAPSIDQRLWTPRTPSENSGTQHRVPQDPHLQPEIPAALPAKSTDLTTFSQRSPRWQLNKNQNNYQVPAPKPQGFRPEPVQNIPSDNKHDTNIKKLQHPSSVPYTDREIASSNITKDKTRGGSTNVIPKQRDNHLTGATSHNDTKNQMYGTERKNSKEESSSSRNVAYQENASNIFNNDKPKMNSENQPKEPISANWFLTPADHDTHVTLSVARKGTSTGNYSNNSHSNHGDKDNDSLRSRSDKDKTSLPHSEFTELKDFEDEEYLPIQRKGDKGNKSNHSDSGVMSAVSDTTPNSSRTANSNTNKQSTKNDRHHGKNVYQNSNFANPGYFSDSSTRRSRVVHSPVTTRNAFNNSPVIREHNSCSPVSRGGDSYGLIEKGSNSNSSNGSSALKTEKLQAGAMFSPIHPQPVTTHRQVKRSDAVSKDILHPTPVSKSGSTDDSDSRRDSESSAEDETIDLKSQLISSHEDQLASVTSLCKQEMKLLLGAKAGNKTFEDYMKKVSDILSQKMASIQLLQDQIIAYQLSTQD